MKLRLIFPKNGDLFYKNHGSASIDVIMGPEEPKKGKFSFAILRCYAKLLEVYRYDSNCNNQGGINYGF